ncbi:TetR/AcrR family transcriptional regulator [Streptomyces winkii]|uniref:TetR/AcrR family transcriptional regulator n=1 Tax=Streptomyces winkii TaxID=3051178 RepID=UPI0028D3AEC6|nr:helix-turn-helix domain-containing protein [Streptomyces sp. DSM 40971]
MRNDARRNRERILAAAESVFGEQGARGSTEDVAQRAGVGIATVFRHFPTKAALIEAALLAHFARLRRRADELVSDQDPERALHALIREMIQAGATKLTLASLLQADSSVPAPVVAASGELRATVEEVLTHAQRTGAVKAAVTVDEIYLLVRSLAQATATEPTNPATLDRAINIVLAGIQTS